MIQSLPRRFAIGSCLMVLLTLLAASAAGQGFMVKPMKMECSPHPGESVGLSIDVRNTAADLPKPMELKLVDLSQDPDGSWQIIEDPTKFDTSRLSSCLTWLTLGKSVIDINPLSSQTVDIAVKVPPSARGTYFAGLLVQGKPSPNAKGLSVLVRFLVPIVVEIQGRPERQKIEFGDAGLLLLAKEDGKSAGASVFVAVDNNGRTYSRVSGNVKVSYFAKNRWLVIADARIRESGIIPGSHLKLPADLGRSLPSGKYKLLANMTIDGRRAKPIEQEFEFAGDPSVTKVAVDTALLVEPSEITITGVPGATRTMSVKVQNASEDVIRVTSASLTPAPMAAGIIGNIRGDDYSCAPWVEMIPAEFTVRPGGKQTVRVIAKVPPDFSKSGYFATLSLRGQYEDGQSAGETQSLVFVENKKVQPQPAGQIIKVTLTAGDPSKYIVQAKLANAGDCRFGPNAKAAVLGSDSKPIVEGEISGMEAPMLPLESRTGSAELDFATVPDGNYILRTTLGFATDKSAAESLPICVATEDGQKVVTVVSTNDAAVGKTPTTAPTVVGLAR